MSKIGSKDFVDRFIELKKGGLNPNEANQLKGAIISSKIDKKLADKLNHEITKDGKIDGDEQVLLQVIGQSVKDTKELKKIEFSIDPSNKKISRLIEKGFNSKIEALKIQKQNLIKNNLTTEDLGYSKLSINDKLSLVYDSYSKEVFKQNEERGVSGMLTDMTLTSFSAKIIPYMVKTAPAKMFVAGFFLSECGKAGYKETDRLSRDISDSMYMIENPNNREDLEKAGKILAKSAFDMRDDLMTVLAGSVASNTKLPTIPKINIKPQNALKLVTVGSIPVAVVEDIPLNLKSKNKLGEAKTNSVILAKKNNVTGENKYIQIKPSDVKALQEGKKGTVVKVKSIAEAEALVKKAFPNYKELESFGTITEKDLNKFPDEIKKVIENRWKNKPTEKWTINKSEQTSLLEWGKKNNKSKVAEGIISDFKKRWFDSNNEFNKGATWYKDYNIADHPKKHNGHGDFPHINIRKPNGFSLEIRIEK